MGQPERLIVDEQLYDLAVGHAEDRLPGFREAVGVLRIDDGPGFIEPVDQGAVFGIRAAFLWTAAHADISIAKRQHRLQLGQEVGTKLFFDDVPFVGGIITAGRRETSMADHEAYPRGRRTEATVTETSLSLPPNSHQALRVPPVLEHRPFHR